MMLGKRTRPPMQRTTSMTEFTLDLNNIVVDSNNPGPLSSPFPRSNRRNSVDFVETASFLRSCFLCKRSLVPGRDIFMYRGDSAFCSLECRQRQMTQDEKREKMTPKKATGISANISVSGKGDTAAAAAAV